MAGGSQLVIDNQGITITTNGEIVFKAGQHLFQSGVEVGVDPRGLPAYEPYNEKFKMLLPSGGAMANIDYKISSDEHNFAAVSDQKGFSKRVNTAEEKNLTLDLNWISLEKEEDQGSDN